MIKKVLIIIIIAFCAFAAFAANEPNQPEQVIEQSKDLRQEILTEDYKLLQQDPNTESISELQKLIDQLNALTFQTKPVETIAPESDIAEVNDVNVIDVNQPAEPNMAELIAELNTDDKFLPDPNTVIDPLSLGDTLYISRKLSSAYVYYKKALELTDDEESSQKAWIIYQLGNCMRKENPAQSVKYYDELLSKFPGSKWADFALVQKQIMALINKENETLAALTNKNQ